MGSPFLVKFLLVESSPEVSLFLVLNTLITYFSIEKSYGRLLAVTPFFCWKKNISFCTNSRRSKLPFSIKIKHLKISCTHLTEWNTNVCTYTNITSLINKIKVINCRFTLLFFYFQDFFCYLLIFLKFIRHKGVGRSNPSESHVIGWADSTQGGGSPQVRFFNNFHKTIWQLSLWAHLAKPMINLPPSLVPQELAIAWLETYPIIIV